MNNLAKVHVSKRNQVLSVIDIVKKHPSVKRIILFGSSVRDDCNDPDDIDICLDIEGPTKGRTFFELGRDICWACDHNCDLLTYQKLSDHLKREVDEKGIVVWQRT